MRFLLLGSFFFVLCSAAVIGSEDSNSTLIKIKSFKETEKFSYPKKVSFLKKNFLKTGLKKRTDITDKFRDLPPDDLAFIKELDKQFKLHGEKVKIKVENKNVTGAKNSKRTIDGDLGYGYQYNSPKFMFYPYSQKNIESSDAHYVLAGGGKTEVSIEPSYSYELKTQSYLRHNEPQIDVPKSNLPEQHYEEPVIVLRIPGPAKYATHLQMLLQKYLEIRAAQYLQILEEAEHGNIKQQQQVEHLNDSYGHNAIADGPTQQHNQNVHSPAQQEYTQQVDYNQQNGMAPQTVQYPDIGNVYQAYKHRHFSPQQQKQQLLHDTQSYYSQQQHLEDEPAPQSEYQHEHEQYQHPQQPQYYYTHAQQYAIPADLPADTYHQVFLVSVPDQVQSEYETSHTHHTTHHTKYIQEESNLPIAENSPRPSHTKVIFTKNNNHAVQDEHMYQLPSIKPNERHAPTSTPDYHQDFQQKSINYQTNYHAADSSSPEVVAITQRPYNYHAHNVKSKTRGSTTHSRRAIKPTAIDDHGLQKIREHALNKLAAETGSAVQFKASSISY